jgi:hypothetical protein
MPLFSSATTFKVGSNSVQKIMYRGNQIWPAASTVNIITSKNNTSAGGLTVGGSITKDMTSITRPANTRIIYPGTTAPPLVTSQYWPDWANDIFDGWGYFYLYDPATNAYYSPILSPVNTADGVITTQTFTAFSRTFTIKHGYPVQGIFKFDISVADGDTFQFGAYGDMGSDGGTVNTNLTQAYTLGGNNYTLYYNRNIQVSPEVFFSYVIPYETDKNNTITYTKLSSGPGVHSGPLEVLSLYTVAVKYGVTVYFAKTNDVKTWVINDLQITTRSL